MDKKKPNPFDKYAEEDMALFFPPKDVHNSEAWDTYWDNQMFENNLGPEFFDIFCDDTDLVEAANRLDLRTVLCVGNGISMEPMALSKAGLDVTAIDISTYAVYSCNDVKRQLGDDSTIFENYFDKSLFRPGGSVEFQVGNIFHSTDAPGPYDIVIERRTIQVFPAETERQEAVDGLIGRLADKGILFSHCHDGRWNPIKDKGTQPSHSTKPIILGRGLEEVNLDKLLSLDRKVAVFLTSSG